MNNSQTNLVLLIVGMIIGGAGVAFVRLWHNPGLGYWLMGVQMGMPLARLILRRAVVPHKK